MFLPVATAVKRRPLIAILLIAFVARFATALWLGNTVSGFSGAHDEISYSMLGQRFSEGHGMTFPTGWYPWIKPDTPQSYYSYTLSLFLAGIYALFGYYPLIARFIMGLFSVLIILMIYLIAKPLFTERIALLASAIAALYAYLIFYGVTLLTETPFTLALLICIYLCLKIKAQESAKLTTWLLLSITLALMVLLRMAVIFFIPILLIWLIMVMKQPRRLYHFYLPALVITVAVLPFTIRNYQLWGHFSLLETQFGHVFWNGNHPNQQWDFHPYHAYPIPQAVLASQNDVEITNQLLQMGIQNVRREPLRFIYVTLARLRELFTFWPTADSGLLANLLRVLSFGWLAPFALVGLAANLRRARELAPLYLFILIHTGVYAISWTMIRYRLPMEPFLIMFGAYMIAEMYTRWLAPIAHRSAKIAVATSLDASRLTH